ncbi:FtsW/RodA/SpoVE family cell cycle protein, partial [Bacillus wiedmannii]|uniref:FtsW/RodA/SpoVE family cell cycle protein n=1 Tax=Bacillus wiedmannii TaxID=1890302 RepID=UPI0024AD0398
FAIIIFLANFLAERHLFITSFLRGLLPGLSFVFLAFWMIMLQPDLGTGTVMVWTCIIMIFISGASVFHFAMFDLLG